MKHLFLATTALCLFSACQQPAATETIDTNVAPVSVAKFDYPYTIEKPDNWTPGDQQHVVTALKGLKGFEDNDMTAAMASFGDSVKLSFNDFEATLSNDSLKAMFSAIRNQQKTLTVKMDDWESVISKDKKTEYVSLWYKEIITDLNGKVDSVECMDDMEIKNGKIVSLNEKQRRYAVKK